MPTTKKPARRAQRDLPAIPKELIDQFVSGPMSAEAIQDASMAFKKALIERALGAELGHHLGYPQGAERPEDSSNQRNGKSGKTVLTDDGPLRLDIPRDRDGSFAPILIPKHERRFTGFDDKIIAMYACGMTVREIRAFLSEQYGTDVSAEAAEQALAASDAGPWGKQYPAKAWQRAWDRVIPFFVFPPPIRKVIYTTNAIESINAQLRKIIKTRGHFPTDDAATKLIWLGLRNITANWGKPAHDWKSAMNQFAILYGDRFIRPTW